MNRVLIGCVWLVWSSCIFVGLLIALEDTLYVQPPKPSMHSSQKELDVAIDRRTGELLLSKLNRPLRGRYLNGATLGGVFFASS